MAEEISFWKQKLTPHQAGFIQGALISMAVIVAIVAFALYRGGV